MYFAFLISIICLCKYSEARSRSLRSVPYYPVVGFLISCLCRYSEARHDLCCQCLITHEGDLGVPCSSPFPMLFNVWMRDMGSLLLNARVRGSPFIPCYSTYECVIWALIFVMREFEVHIFLGYSTPVLRLHSSLLCIRAPSVYGNISSTITDSSDYSCFVCFIVGL